MYTDDVRFCGFMSCQGNVVKIALFIEQLLTAVAECLVILNSIVDEENYFQK